jgi:ribonuclease HI
MAYIYNQKSTTKQADVIIFTDGGALNNPGPAAIGVLIKAGSRIKEYAEPIGKRTNNQAEYEAVLFALSKIKALLGKNKVKTAKIQINLDSELIANQLTGKYKIEEEELQKLFVRFWNLKLDFDNLNINLIPREQNLAHKLVEKILKNKERLF